MRYYGDALRPLNQPNCAKVAIALIHHIDPESLTSPTMAEPRVAQKWPGWCGGSQVWCTKSPAAYAKSVHLIVSSCGFDFHSDFPLACINVLVDIICKFEISAKSLTEVAGCTKENLQPPLQLERIYQVLHVQKMEGLEEGKRANDFTNHKYGIWYKTKVIYHR